MVFSFGKSNFQQNVGLVIVIGALFFVGCTLAFCFKPPTLVQQYTASCISSTHTIPYSKTRLYSSNDDSSIEMPNDKEETLLRLRLALRDNDDNDKALAAVQSFCQSFPFAVILPVQPMQYLPTLEGGVDVVFMRKKTQQKGSVDGGMKIYISQCNSDSDDNDTSIEVLIKRNSKGQVVSKMFSEKLIVQALVKAFSGETDDRIPEAPLDLVEIQSVFHKWLDNNQVAEK